MKDFEYSQTYLYKLHLITHNLENLINRIINQVDGITLSQFQLLVSIRQNQPINQREVAKFLKLSPAAVSRQVERLNQKQWINITPSEKDRRDDVLTISEPGQKVASKSLELIEGEINEIFEKQDCNLGLNNHLDALLVGTERVSKKAVKSKISQGDMK